MSPRTKRILVAAGVAFLAALLGGRALAGFYVDAVWFRHLGYEAVFYRVFWTRLLVHFAAGLLAAGFCFANLTGLFRMVPGLQVRRRRYANIEFAEAIPARLYVAGAGLVSILFGAWTGRFLAGSTFEILAWLSAVPWDVSDPVFGRDLSFYVFDLPAYSALHTYAVLTLLGTAILSLVTHLLGGSIRVAEGRLSIAYETRVHLTLFVAWAFLLLAWGYALGLFGILNSGRGPTDALGYTDAATRIPGHRIMIVVSLLAAAAAFVAVWRRSGAWLTGGVAAVVFGVAFIGHAWPAAVQKLRVDPNELALERPYIGMNMEFTRRAYGLDRIASRFYPYRPEARPAASAVTAATRGLPLWDERSLKTVYDQFQGLATYYSFPSVHFDRYGPPDDPELVAVAVREVDTTRVAPQSLTWQNLHVGSTYTRGVGLVMSAASRAGPTGEPIDYVYGLPPVVAAGAPGGVELTQPEIYFGERTRAFVLYRPAGAREEAVADEGPEPRGVELDSWFRRLALAWAFEDKNLLLSQAARNGSRILYHRQIEERLSRLLPFLAYGARAGGAEAYPALADGRIHWIVEGYTATRRFPLAQRGPGGARYLRNSVKATVDALTGAVRFYVAEPDDPMAQVLERIFPGVLLPLDSMPDALRRHLRYPRGLLEVQGSMLLGYHVPGPDSLYHSIDVWDVAKELYPGDDESRVEPTYFLRADPGSARPEFAAYYSFTPRGRDNLRAFLVARGDPAADPRVTLHHLPPEQILGPRQVEALIRQDPYISQQLNLWAQRGVAVTRGHLLLVPVDSSFVFVKPLYLAAQGSGAVPGLRRIIVAQGTRVAMGSDLAGALEALESGARAPAPELLPIEAVPPAAGTLDEELRALIERADSALRRGDLRAFSEAWEEIRRAARRPDARP